MKILHTGDWHLGKRLYKHDLCDDHELFLNWLVTQIDERNIDVLLIAGDIFDTTNPNDGSMALYYKFLTRMLPLGRKIIITGGNHDSPAKLNAPRELLRHLNIHIIGCTTRQCADEVFRLTKGSVDLVVAAVPYLRDADLRQSIAGQTYEERISALRMGIRNHYERIADYCAGQYTNVPVLAMGHLYVNGASVSDSEREIHSVGGQAAFSTEQFPGDFNYVALGHIHRPQTLGADERVRYSGSPLPLSFSERDHTHQVLELTLANGQLSGVEPLRVPRFRRLQHVCGTLDEVRDALGKLTAGSDPLPPLVEILVEEAQESHHTRLLFEGLQRDFSGASFSIAKARLLFQNKQQGLDTLLGADTYLQDLSYLDVFERRLTAALVEGAQRSTLTETYKQLYQMVTEQRLPMPLHEDSPNPLS